MASRMKKIFHHKSQNLQPEPLHDGNGPIEGPGDSVIRATPYDATAPGGLPETGTYPIKGDGSSTVIQNNVPSNYNRGQQGARNDLSHLPSASSQPSAAREPPHSTIASANDRPYSGSYKTAQLNNMPGREHIGGRDFPSETPLAQDLSGLSLGDDEARAYRTPPRRSFQPSSNFDGVYNPYLDTRQRRSNDLQDDPDLSRETAIPRKQVGSSPRAPYSGNPSPTGQYAPAGDDPRASIGKPLPSAPALNHNSYQPRRGQDAVQPSGILDRSRPISRSAGGAAYTAQDVVQRAQHNSAHTEVIERIAPAIVHETVQKQVHHVQEEVVTREIHDHDIYHRILPVVDVEVLPPRHFLPVEGGGLVEIGASDVPGRAKNWVIAETASKIPSDQPAHVLPSRFSAREFHGVEGDTIRYETPEGIERTEHTWVHPPELETGGRDSGQTWPMVFREGVPEKHHRHPSGASHKSKGHRKTSSKHSTPLIGADQSGRIV